MACATIHLAIAKKYFETHTTLNYKDVIAGTLYPDAADNNDESHYTNLNRVNDNVSHVRGKVNLYSFLKDHKYLNDFELGWFLRLFTDYLFFEECFNTEYLLENSYEQFCKDLYFAYSHYGFKVVDEIGDYELLALQFEDVETPRFNDNARNMKIDNQDFTIYYSNECPYVEYEVKELTEYAKENNIKINFIKIDSLEKAKNAPCIFNNWANFYKGEFISNTILNANSFEKLISE